jgi:glycerol-1-phosphate dehydrogenase [NAD(P)+]
MVMKPIYGKGIATETLEGLDHYLLITMKEPWEILNSKISKKPSKIIFNNSMDNRHLEELFVNLESLLDKSYTIIGLGGGTSCDTAKYVSWKLKEEIGIELDLILIPSIISVDAFLCSSIAVRYDNKVNYIGESSPKKIIIDYDLIKKAPKYLNRSGVSDTISITSALGDWKLAHKENSERFDNAIFDQAKIIAKDLMKARNDIREVNEKGIKALVEGFFREVNLCNKWGNARPEEGSEHFLAYCIESITHSHYIHGQIIGMNILISLNLQEELAEFSIEEIRQFFNDIKLDISPESLDISSEILRRSLKKVQEYVREEGLMYSIYNSPKLTLDNKKINEIIQFVKSV